MRAGENCITYHRFDDWELDYVSRHLHESDDELADRIGRTSFAVREIRNEIDRLVNGGLCRRARRGFAV